MEANTPPGRIDHAAEAIRIIDQRLLEEEMVLDSLRQAVARNSIDPEQAESYYLSYRMALRARYEEGLDG